MENLELPQDSQGYVRRECPCCRRQYKTRPSPLDALCLQQELALGVMHRNGDELSQESGRWLCFYCGKPATPRETLTPEQRTWLEGVSHALAQQVRYEQLAHVTRTISDNPLLTFAPVRPPPLPKPLPREPDDMRRFYLVCCAEDVKAASGWEQRYHCPRCGTEHERGGKPVARMPMTMIRE